MSSRAGIVVTGTEVLTGRVTDRNGPWLAEQLRVAGIDVTQVVVVGDRPDDMHDALRFFRDARVDLIITSGGLGPTDDDRTAEVVGGFQRRPLELDASLEQRITAIIGRIRANGAWRMDDTAAAAGTRKQALVPRGADVLEPAGTAPGLVVPAPAGRPGPPVLVLPGPPREVQAMWSAALDNPTVRTALAGAQELRQRTILLWGTAESDLAATLREHEQLQVGLEITTCLRDGELEIVTRYAPDAQDTYDALHRVLVDTYADTVYSPDGETVDEIVARRLLERRLTVATAESCTGGLLSGRLTDLAGSSAYVTGALTVYSNDAKHRLAGVPTELIERVGAVSAEVARALADGARERVGTDVGVGITGIAGPGGGTPDKPVGLVYLCASDGAQVLERRIVSPGSRADVRRRSVTIAMHMLRELLAQPPR
ncbi:competence/damage-inducible protein A [uncultured Jatrophihabitans sp.]|uniref:competence/damage-inducible protein A n=1 Tax=uncultured Jatrophihabitans sp. TaxID=1610747 RepID=UPI0035C9EBD9